MYPRIKFFHVLAKYLHEENNYIVNGDFNCQLDIKNNDRSVSKLNKLILNQELMYDVWRTIYPDEHGYTFYHKILKRSSRIDYSFISNNLLFMIPDASVSSVGLSDHHALSFHIQRQEVKRGPGRWFCNNNALKDDQCKDRITFFWEFWQSKKATF